MAEYIPPIKAEEKNVKRVPCVSLTSGLFKGFLSLWFKSVTIRPVISPHKIAGKGSGLIIDVAA